MRYRLKLIWTVVAIVLVAPTTTWDLQALFDSETPKLRRHAPRQATASIPAQQATPAPSLQYNLCPGEVTSLRHEVQIPPAPLQADILFAFDTTGSMNEVIEEAQESSVDIVANLQSLIPDVRFGLVDFRDYTELPYGKSSDWPYRLRQPLTHQASEVQAKIGELEDDGGLDEPEAYTRALYEAYADPNIGWRPGARRFIVMFGDSVPHDDDLNAGVPTPQPHRPNKTWQTGYPPSHLDPGRDATDGTADDLDFQPVLSQLRDRSISLLFVVVDTHLLIGVETEELFIYWRTWASMTGAGGGARVLEDVQELPATIQALVAAASRRIERLTVRVEPAELRNWVSVVPPVYEELDIPANGLALDFLVTIHAPLDVPAGQYTFDLVTEGDGTVYQRQRVEITVPASCFATPTPTWVPLPTPKPHWTLYLPIVAKNHRNQLDGGS